MHVMFKSKQFLKLQFLRLNLRRVERSILNLRYCMGFLYIVKPALCSNCVLSREFFKIRPSETQFESIVYAIVFNLRKFYVPKRCTI